MKREDMLKYLMMLTKLGVRHFGKLFSKPERCNLPHILSVIRKFPRFIDEEEDEEFFQKISLEELLAAMKTFQKDRSPGPDGWTVGFFFWLKKLYEIKCTDLDLAREQPLNNKKILYLFLREIQYNQRHLTALLICCTAQVLFLLYESALLCTDRLLSVSLQL
jgi:hypothetical protein